MKVHRDVATYFPWGPADGRRPAVFWWLIGLRVTAAPMSQCPDLARKEHSNILLFRYLVVVVRAGFGGWLSINNFFTGKSQMGSAGARSHSGCRPDYFQE